MGSITFSNHLEKHGILTFRQGTPTLELALTQLFPPSDPEKISEILPYALLVQNNTSRPLMAITVFYVTFLADYPGKRLTSRISPAACANHPSLMFQPGAYILITPFSEIYCSLDASMNPQIRPAITEHALRHIENTLAFYRNSQVTISLDSLVTEHGLLLGPDEAGYEHFARAKRDTAIEVFEQAETLTGGDLQNYLARLNAIEPDITDPHTYHLWTNGSSLFDDLQRKGEAELKRELADLIPYFRAKPIIKRG